MSGEVDTGPRYLTLATLAATVAAAVPGAILVSATLTSNVSPYAIDPGAFVAVLIAGLFIAFLHMGLLGLPLYAFMARRWALRWWNAALAGFAVGALPLAMWITPQLDRDSARELLSWVAWAGAYGTLGGLAFFAVLALGERGR